jgi:hypothetical protein
MPTKKKVISTKNMPVRFPLITMAVIYLYLDKYNAPQWLYGVVITLAVLVAITFFYAKYQEESVDILEDKNVRHE